MKDLIFFQSCTSFVDRKEWIGELRNVIEYHSEQYYQNNNPEISDQEFDQLFGLLQQWEKQDPVLYSLDSPTNKVGGGVSQKLEKIQHLSPMISLGNVFTKEELKKWEERWEKKIDIEEYKEDESLYIVEPKFDGLGVSCVWEEGKLNRILTRGDGEYGENVLHNREYIQGVDFVLSDTHVKDLELRGEAVMKKSVFESVNNRLAHQNKKIFSNPRNCASGLLRHIHSEKEERGELSVFFYECPEEQVRTDLGIKSYADTILFLQKHGIPSSPHYFLCRNLEEVFSSIKDIEEMRESLDYDIDGVVIKINSYALRNQIGSTSHHPRWAVAWKFPATQATTRVKSIEWQVGRTGVLTPVAHLDPVEINGVKVSKSTLHNFDTIMQKDIRIHDTVFVERSGDVIPKITSVVRAKREKGAVREVRPEKCVECGSKIIQKKGEVAIRCSNELCPKRVEEQLIHFASKKAMNIVGLGESICRQLISKKLICTVADLFDLTAEDLYKIEGFKEKSVQNLLQSLGKSQKNPFWRVLHGIGIPNVGVQTAKILSKQYLCFEALKKASVSDLVNINDIGEKMGEEIVYFLHDPLNQDMLSKLDQALRGNNLESERIQHTSVLSEKKVVITGSLKQCSRDEAIDYIEQAGGGVVSSISSKTDYVLVGEKAGGKKQKAEELGISILLEEEFWKMVFGKSISKKAGVSLQKESGNNLETPPPSLF